MQASILIIARNEGEALLRTVDSCCRDLGDVHPIDGQWEVLVADDASEDDSVELVRRAHPFVRVVSHAEKRGVALTKDLAARSAAGRVLVFLDGHCKPEPGALARLVDDVQCCDGDVVVTPRVPALDAETWENDMTRVGHGYGVDLQTLAAGWIEPEAMPAWQGPAGRTFFVQPAVCGCVLATSRWLYDNVLGFDTGMELYGSEDLDFAVKVWLMGGRVLYDPVPVVGHRFSDHWRGDPVPESVLLANQIRMARKNFSDAVWFDWVDRASRRYPAETWDAAWQSFLARYESIERERAYLMALRPRDEFWYAAEFGCGWPLAQGGAMPSQSGPCSFAASAGAEDAGEPIASLLGTPTPAPMLSRLTPTPAPLAYGFTPTPAPALCGSTPKASLRMGWFTPTPAPQFLAAFTPTPAPQRLKSLTPTPAPRWASLGTPTPSPLAAASPPTARRSRFTPTPAPQVIVGSQEWVVAGLGAPPTPPVGPVAPQTGGYGSAVLPAGVGGGDARSTGWRMMPGNGRLGRARVLAAVANYGPLGPECRQAISALQRIPCPMHVVVHSERPKLVPAGAEVIVGLPSDHPHSLTFAHRELFAARLEDYDLFVYLEDDLLLSPENLEAFLEVAAVLPEDEIAGFVRYEADDAGTRRMVDAHEPFGWVADSVRAIGPYRFAAFSNPHSGCYAVGRRQLRKAIESGGYLVPPHAAFVGMRETAATDVYLHCGLAKRICVSHWERFLVRHLRRNAERILGTPESEFTAQLAALAP